VGVELRPPFNKEGDCGSNPLLLETRKQVKEGLVLVILEIERSEGRSSP